jgi:uncharacterized Zn finger protein (UPF0148 family)
MDTGNSAVAQLGARMLAGWALLAQECTECDPPPPLVRHARSGVIECVMCGAKFEVQRDNAFNEDVYVCVSKKKDEESAGEGGDAQLQVSEKSEIETACKSGPGDFLEPAKPSGESSGNINFSDDGAVAQEFADRRGGGKPLTGKLGDYLLRGWTMLADNCPRCQVPLMRKPAREGENGSMMCVSCGSQVIRPEDYDPTKHKIQNPSAALPAAPAAAAAAIAPEDTIRAEEPVQEHRQFSERVKAAERGEGLVPKRVYGDDDGLRGSPVVGDTSLEDVRSWPAEPDRESPVASPRLGVHERPAGWAPTFHSDSLVEVLRHKLSVLRDILDATPDADIHRVVQLSDAITSVARALEAARAARL